MAISREDYEAHRSRAEAAVLAAASVIPPAGTDQGSLARWRTELVAAAGVVQAAIADAAAVLKEATFTGTLMSVENPARREDGTALGMAKVTIRGDVGDPKKPDRPWIDLRAPGGPELARAAESLVGSRVRYRQRQVAEMSGTRPVYDGEAIATRTRLVGIEALDSVERKSA